MTLVWIQLGECGLHRQHDSHQHWHTTGHKALVHARRYAIRVYRAWKHAVAQQLAASVERLCSNSQGGELWAPALLLTHFVSLTHSYATVVR